MAMTGGYAIEIVTEIAIEIAIAGFNKYEN
jgi:hypothetical protein